MPTCDCLSEADLRAFQLGELPGRVATLIAGHLETCPVCAALADQLDGVADPCIVHLRRAAGQPTPPQLPSHAVDMEGQAVLGNATAPTDGGFPRRFGDYELLGELGRGGMSVVYLARQKRPARVVALKMILAGGHAGAERRTRFLAEADAIARLQHPHIVQIYQAGEHDGQLFLALEWLDGGNLAQFLDGQPQEPAAAAGLVEILAHTVHHAHRHGIVHRDLKPANVLLSFNCDPSAGAPAVEARTLLGAVAKIADFGLAKQDAVNLTATGALLGTPAYMAPEQAGGDNATVGPPADVYALGAVLYVLLTGRPPFQGANALETLEQVRSSEPVPPAQLQPRVPRDLETICLQCLQKAPARRYASAEELAEDLHRYLSGEPVRARPVGAWERAAKWARRRPAAAALAAVSVAAVLVLLGGWLHFTARLRAEGTTTRAERDRARQQEAETARELDRARRALFTAQLWRVAAVWEREPDEALQLLHDPQACPADLRDFAWRLYARRCRRARPPLHGLARELRPIAFSPRGTILATRDGQTLTLWDPTTGQEIRTLTGDPLPYFWDALVNVNKLAISPDNQLLATCSQGGTVWLWDLATGRPTASLKGPDSAVQSVAFSPDGKTLAAGACRGPIWLWDVATGTVRNTLTFQEEAWNRFSIVGSVTFSPDGKTLAAWKDVGIAVFWNPATGKVTTTFREQPAGTGSFMLLSPDGKTAVVSAGNPVTLWDVPTGRPRGVLKGQPAYSGPLAFSPDSQTLATAEFISADWEGTTVVTVTLWDVASGERRLTLKSNREITCLAFSADGKMLAAGCRSGGLLLWDVTTGLGQVSLRRCYPAGYPAVLSRNGRHLAAWSNDHQVSVWDTATGRQRASFVAKIGWVKAISPDGRTAALDCGERGVALFDVITGRARATLVVQKASLLSSLEFSPDSKTLASGEEDGTVRLWDVSSGRPKGTWKGHRGAVTVLAFSPDGRTLASASSDPIAKAPPEVKVWHADTGWMSASPGWPVGVIESLAFSPDGATLAAAGAVAAPFRTFPEAEDCSPDGVTPPPARGERDGKEEAGLVKLWEVSTGKDLASLRGRAGSYDAVAFSPDGKSLAVGVDRVEAIGPGPCAVELWDVTTKQHRASLSGHLDSVHHVSFTADGKALISFSEEEGTVRLWQAGPAAQ